MRLYSRIAYALQGLAALPGLRAEVLARPLAADTSTRASIQPTDDLLALCRHRIAEAEVDLATRRAWLSEAAAAPPGAFFDVAPSAGAPQAATPAIGPQLERSVLAMV